MYRTLLLMLIMSILLPGCNYSPFHQKWACESGEEDLKLRCEASKEIPFLRSAEHLHSIDLCKPKSDYYEETVAISWVSIEEMGHYVAAGGYCDFHSRYDGILNHLENIDKTFGGMLFQVHSCAPDRYHDLNLRAENLGLRVTSHHLKDCDVQVE